MYGMMPKAKIENLRRAPPANKSTIPKKPSEESEDIPETTRLFMPGMVTWVPIRNRSNMVIVNKIFFLNSGILVIFVRVFHIGLCFRL